MSDGVEQGRLYGIHRRLRAWGGHGGGLDKRAGLLAATSRLSRGWYGFFCLGLVALNGFFMLVRNFDVQYWWVPYSTEVHAYIRCNILGIILGEENRLCRKVQCLD